MRKLILFSILLSHFAAGAQYYKKKLLTEKDGLLNDEVNRLFIDSSSGILFVSHPVGISKVFGQDVETTSIPEYQSKLHDYPFEVIDNDLYLHHFKIKHKGYELKEFPFPNFHQQIAFTESGSDTINSRIEAFRASDGSFWLNQKGPNESFVLKKINGGDTIELEVPTEHKVRFKASFANYYNVEDRAKIFAEDNKERIWLLSQENELMFFEKDSNRAKLSKMKSQNIFDVFQTEDGDYLISTYATPEESHGVNIYQKDGSHKFYETNSPAIIYRDNDHSAFICDNKSLLRFKNGKLDTLFQSEFLFRHASDTLGNQYLWCVSIDYTTYLVKLDKELRKDTLLESAEKFKDIEVSQDGVVFIGTNNGIIHLQPTNIDYQEYSFYDPQSPSSFVYIGNNGKGLSFYKDPSFLAHGNGKTIRLEDEVYDHFYAKNGNFYGHLINFGASSEDLEENFYLVDTNSTLKKIKQSGLDEYDYRLANDYYGAIYKNQFYLNSNQGVYAYNGSGFTKYPMPKKVSEGSIIEVVWGKAYFKLFNVIENYLDASRRKVVDHIQFNFQNRQFEELDWSVDDVFYEMIYGGKGKNFLAKVAGQDKILNRYEGKSKLLDIPRSKVNDSLIYEVAPNNPWLIFPEIDREGNYYFDASIHGLLVFYPQEDKFVQICNKNGLFGTDVLKIFFNNDSTKLYVISYEGMQEMSLEEIKSGKIENSRFWLRYRGMKGITGHQWLNDSILRLHKDYGYLDLNLSQEFLNEPKLVLEEMLIDNETFDAERYHGTVKSSGIHSYPIDFSLPFSKNYISFNFQGIDHFSQEVLNYEYQLIGMDDKAMQTEFSSLSYQNLPSGEYTFKIKAINDLGISSEEIVIPFTVEKPFYEKAWFIILCILGLALVWTAIYRWRIRTLKRREIILKKLVKEKTIELEEEKNHAVEQKGIIEEKNREITDSISYSKRLQNSILPNLESIKLALPDSFVLFQPKDIVSGDFYWFEKIDDTIFIACADCTGHGVPGAMVSLVCANALNRCVNEFKVYDPAEILNRSREMIVKAFEKGGSGVKDGMDISLLAIKGKKMIYAGAYNSALVIRDKQEIPNVDDRERFRDLEIVNDQQIIEIKADKQPVASFDQMFPFHQVEFELQKGDCIYLASDGFVDQFGGDKGKKFKAPNFRKLLLSICNLKMLKQKEKLQDAFIDWMGDEEQVDDVCVIGIRI